jgi:hypothetical protein
MHTFVNAYSVILYIHKYITRCLFNYIITVLLVNKFFKFSLTAFHGEFAELLIVGILVELHCTGQQQSQPEQRKS